jgi:hypothetical protein
LKSYDAVVFYTTGELPIGDADKTNLLAWVKSGKGFAGIHSATDTFYQWPEYGEMIGGYFDNHPWHEDHGEDRGRQVACRAAFRGPTWILTDEIYQFRNWDRSKRHVLLSLDMTSVDLKAKGVKRTDGDFRARLDQHDGQRPRLLHGARPPPRGVAVARVPSPPGRRHQVDSGLDQ